MLLSLNFLVLPIANLSINGSWAMRVDRVTLNFSQGGCVGGWMLLSSLKVTTEPSLKLQIQQEFARITAVFNLTSVAFG